MKDTRMIIEQWEVVRGRIVECLRAVNKMSIDNKVAGGLLKVEGKLSIGIDCKESDFDKAMDSINNTHWFGRSGYQFLVNKISVQFYII